MNTMYKEQANISTNILRDQDVELNYIVTPNSQEIFEQVAGSYGSNKKAFNIIGSYGTGKSTFLWALERNFKNKSLPFGYVKAIPEDVSFDFLKFIGESRSFKQSFIEDIGADSGVSDKELDELLKIAGL